MAHRDDQVVRTPNADAPFDYPVPQNVELILRGVRAKFADNGTAGDWLPCVDLISDSGHRIARCADPNVKVTAGDDADVSWFPGVKPTGGGGGTSTALAYARAWNDHSVGDPFQNVLAGTAASGSFAHTQTTASSIISFSTTINTNDTATLIADGTYLLMVGVKWETIDPDLNSTIYKLAGVDNALLHQPFKPDLFPLFLDSLGACTTMDFTVGHVSGTGIEEIVSHSNRTGVDRVVNACYFTIIYFGTG